MTLPTDYVDGDILTAADVNAITTAVNGISPVIQKYSFIRDTGTYTTTSTSFTNTNVSLSYTPLNASNNLVIEATFSAAFIGENINTQIRQVTFQIWDSTNSAEIASGEIYYEQELASDDPEQISMAVCLRGTTSAGNTNARTYVLRYKTTSASYQAAIGTKPILSVMEVKP